jgi:pilus assembly protein Flp/PilA
MRNFVKTFLSNESGATAIEYGLIAAVTTVGTNLKGTFNNVANGVK